MTKFKTVIDVNNQTAATFYGEQKLQEIILDAAKEMKMSKIPYKRVRFILYGVSVDLKMDVRKK